MANCYLCGAKLPMFGGTFKLSNIPTYGSIIHADGIVLCENCYGDFEHAMQLNDYEHEFPSVVKEAAQLHYSRGAKALEKAANSTNNEWIRAEINNLLPVANRIALFDHNYETIFEQVIDKIEAEYMTLPNNTPIDIETSTFDVDDKYLYYMKYGNPVLESQELKNIKGITKRLEVINILEEAANSGSIIERLKIEDIFYFQEKGSIDYSTNVKGGGAIGGGTNISNAIIGGILFGKAGAIVGSQVGTEVRVRDVYSETVEHDNRYVILKYKEENGTVAEAQFSYEYFYVFNTLIPQKEYSFVSLGKDKEAKIEQESNVAKPSDFVEELKALKSLLDLGILTQEEFDTKKKQILGI